MCDTKCSASPTPLLSTSALWQSWTGRLPALYPVDAALHGQQMVAIAKDLLIQNAHVPAVLQVNAACHGVTVSRYVVPCVQVVYSQDHATRAAKAAVAQLQLIQRRPDEAGSANPFALPAAREADVNRERRR
jgi:hypothetical protein